ELVPEGRSEDLLNPRLGAFADVKDLIRARLADMFTKPAGADAGAAYESRVLEGIWATAPYLHNGSVPNLWELLLPAKERRGTFKVGSRRFDPKNVGFDTESSPFANGTFVADPGNGNGNGCHEYGTSLRDDDRWALVEYMKTLRGAPAHRRVSWEGGVDDDRTAGA